MQASLPEPDCAKNGQTFCEDIDTYPLNKVETILQKNTSLNMMFSVDKLPNEPVNRAGGQDDQFLCESNRVVAFPKVGKTQGNRWKYIVNQGKETEQVQGILVETCRK